MQYFDELLSVLQKHSLDKKDVILCNSCALAARGLYENSDVDILIRPGVREDLLRKNRIKTLGTGTFDLSEHVQSVWNKYEPLGYDDEKVFQMNDLLECDGIAVVPLELELARKINENREKNAVGIGNIERYILSGGDFDFVFFKTILDVLFQKRSFDERIKNWLKYCNPRRSGIGPFLVNLGAKIKRRIVSNEMIRPSESFSQHLSYLVSPGELLEIQGGEGWRTRFDVLVNYHCIKQWVETQNDDAFCLYLKKQNKRRAAAQTDGFKSLIKNMQQNGFLVSRPILVDAEGHLVDGAHRLACALYFHVDFVSVKIVQKRAQVEYGRDWFSQNGFTDEELRQVDDAATELALKNGLYTTAIMWGYAEGEWENIVRIIESDYVVVERGTLDLKDSMPGFIQEVYGLDGIALWKVLFKSARLASHPHKIAYLVFDVPAMRFRRREDGMSMLEDVIKLKASIRSNVSKKMKDYVEYSDTIIHMGDNPLSNKKIREIICKYAEKKED